MFWAEVLQFRGTFDESFVRRVTYGVSWLEIFFSWKLLCYTVS